MVIPAFEEQNFTDHTPHDGYRVITVFDATEEAFIAYCKLFEENGYVKKEGRCRYAAFQNNSNAIFLNFYRSVGELRIVMEENCNYFSFADVTTDALVSPQITQVHLEDFGMSYCVRLSDGRFIIFDGGRDFPPDADELYRVLQAGTPHPKPIIAAWIMTHPHSDHVPCIHPFMEQHGDEVIIQKFLYNFPRPADYVDPEKPKEEKTLYEFTDKALVEPFEAVVKDLGVPVYTPHTGQIYRIGDAVCEVLASLDDSVHISNKINPTSLILRMELGGQIILWAADGSFSDVKLVERYGEYLKADILQVPHHGFTSGTDEAQKRGYDIIRPHTCLLPVSDYNAYCVFCAHKQGTKHLMTNVDVQEMITGDTTRTLTLPYTPSPYGAREMERKYREGQASAGAKTWIFAELSTAQPDDFVYTLLNTTHAPAQVTFELFFDSKKKAIRHIKTTIPPMTFRHFSVIDEQEVESETVYYNPWSLATRGIPENEPFVLRIMSDTPIIVSHKEHRDTYHA